MENTDTTDIKTERSFSLFIPEKYRNLSLEVPKFLKLATDENLADLIIQGYSPEIGIEIFCKSLNIRQYVKLSNISYFLEKYEYLLEQRKTDKNKDLLSLLDKTNEKLKILQKVEISSNIHRFIENLFLIDFFSSFSTIYLFIHEKGHKNVAQIEYQKNSIKQHSILISEFNELFNAIKKSKNRSFGQENLKGVSFNIIGTCIGHELNLDQHNVIMVISKNDFLPQTKEDIQSFNQYLPYISFGINYFLIKNLILDNKQTIMKSIETISGDYGPDKNDPNYKDKDLEESFDIEHKQRISLLGELLNTLKHELSNPLFGLKLTTDLLLLEDFSEENQEFVSEISKAVDRCQKILNSFTHIYGASNTVQEINIFSFINEVVTLTKSESRTIQKRILLNNQDLSIKSNKTLLAQILFNILLNSIQALNNSGTEAASIEINVNADSQHVYINLKDNGPGFDNFAKENIFKPFYTTKKSGTGLGLPIAKNLTEKLGGSLDIIDSDNGAHFLLRLPYEHSNS